MTWLVRRSVLAVVLTGLVVGCSSAPDNLPTLAEIAEPLQAGDVLTQAVWDELAEKTCASGNPSGTAHDFVTDHPELYAKAQTAELSPEEAHVVWRAQIGAILWNWARFREGCPIDGWFDELQNDEDS